MSNYDNLKKICDNNLNDIEETEIINKFKKINAKQEEIRLFYIMLLIKKNILHYVNIDMIL